MVASSLSFTGLATVAAFCSGALGAGLPHAVESMLIRRNLGYGNAGMDLTIRESRRAPGQCGQVGSCFLECQQLVDHDELRVALGA